MSTQPPSKPVWDRGDPIDAEMLAFTVGDDWKMDQRLVQQDLRGSLAHARMLAKVGLLAPADAERILAGLEQLAKSHAAGD